MYFPVDLVISHINASTFPTKTSLKKYIEEDMQLGYVTKITFISATKRENYNLGDRFDCTFVIHEEEKDMEDFTTDIPNKWTGDVTIVRYRAIIELEWDFSKKWNIDVNKIPICSHVRNYPRDHRPNIINRPGVWYQYYIEDNKDFMDISIQDRIRHPLHYVKYLYDKIEKQKQTESEIVELKGHIENLLYDKFEMAARIHVLESQIQQVLEKEKEKENNKSLLSYIFDKTK